MVLAVNVNYESFYLIDLRTRVPLNFSLVPNDLIALYLKTKERQVSL